MTRPMLAPTPLTEGFWAAAARRKLVVQSCDACDALRHYPSPMCPQCHSLDWSWRPVCGRGRVYTYTITHQAFHPEWAGRLPVAIATIELEEGVRMMTDLPAADTDRVHIGMAVEVFFDEVPVADGRQVTLPRFRATAL